MKPFPLLHRDNPDVWAAVKKLQSFAVPVFMVEKMKSFMRSVQGRRRCQQVSCGGRGPQAKPRQLQTKLGHDPIS